MKLEVIIKPEGKKNSKHFYFDDTEKCIQSLLAAIDDELNDTEALTKIEFIPNEPS